MGLRVATTLPAPLMPLILPILPTPSHLLTLDLIEKLGLGIGRLQAGAAHNSRLHTYNPSLVMLPPNMRASLDATYAVLLKVTNHNNCYSLYTPKPNPCVTYVGLSLLDRDLWPIPGREALISWNQLRESICSRTPYEDCRLAVHDQQLLLVCKTMLRVIRLEVGRPQSNESHHLWFHPQAPLISSAPDFKISKDTPTIGTDAHYIASRGAGLMLSLHTNHTEIARSAFFCRRADTGSSLTFCGKCAKHI